MLTIPDNAWDKILLESKTRLKNNHIDDKYDFEKGCEYGYQLATDGRESFWTEEMILRFAELYRWSSGRITMKGLKESSRDWQTADISALKEIAKQIDDGREELRSLV